MWFPVAVWWSFTNCYTPALLFYLTLSVTVDNANYFVGSSTLSLVNPEPEFGGGHAVSAKHERITGIWGQNLWSGDLKLNAFLHYHNPSSRPICPEICYFAVPKIFVGRLEGPRLPWPPESASVHCTIRPFNLRSTNVCFDCHRNNLDRFPLLWYKQIL